MGSSKRSIVERASELLVGSPNRASLFTHKPRHESSCLQAGIQRRCSVCTPSSTLKAMQQQELLCEMLTNTISSWHVSCTNNNNNIKLTLLAHTRWAKHAWWPAPAIALSCCFCTYYCLSQRYSVNAYSEEGQKTCGTDHTLGLSVRSWRGVAEAKYEWQVCTTPRQRPTRITALSCAWGIYVKPTFNLNLSTSQWGPSASVEFHP